KQLGAGKAPAGDPVQSPARERILGRAARALGVREPAGSAAARGERGGDLLQAVYASDLLDQVDLACDVIAAQWRYGHLQAVLGRLAVEVKRAQDLDLALARHRRAEDRAHAVLAQAQHARRRRPPYEVDRALLEAGAAQLDEQATRNSLRVQALLRLQPLLEARGSLATDVELRGGALDIWSIPRGPLEPPP